MKPTCAAPFRHPVMSAAAICREAPVFSQRSGVAQPASASNTAPRSVTGTTLRMAVIWSTPERDLGRGESVMARIAVGGFQHETNTFAPQQATWDDFVRADAWPPLLRGPEMIEGVEGFNIPISGAVKRLAELGHEIVPLAWAAAAPASYVTEDAYEKMWALFDEDLRKFGPFDAVYLDLHGAMVVENTEDGEGELL